MVDPRRDAGPLDVEEWLAGLGEELADYGYGAFVPFRTETTTWRANWKLLLDTFFESYHVFSLHRESLGTLYPGLASPVSALGPHNRIVVPQGSLLDLADQPESAWVLGPHAVVQYFVAPDLIFSNLDRAPPDLAVPPDLGRHHRGHPGALHPRAGDRRGDPLAVRPPLRVGSGHHRPGGLPRIRTGPRQPGQRSG